MTANIIRLDAEFQDNQATIIPNYKPAPIIRTSISFNSIMNQIRRDFQALVQDKDNPVTNVWIGTNQKFLDILKLSRSSSDEVSLKTFLCPLYTQVWWISWEYTDFWEVPVRAQKKMESYERMIEVIRKYIPIRVSFLLADRWISITDSTYPLDRLDTDIEKMRLLFEWEVQYRLWKDTKVITFSDIGVPIDRVTRDMAPTQEEIKNLFVQYGADFSKFKNQYQILAQSFWPGWAYSICRDYLAESRFTAETDKDSIYLNVESCSPMNTLYQIWEIWKRLIDTNLYIWASYRV